MLSGYKYAVSSTQLRVIERAHDKHVQTVELIHHPVRKSVHRDDELERMNKRHEFSRKFVNNEKFNDIDKANQMLLTKLVDISRKKPANFITEAKKQEKKTLHAPYKKREMLKITMENEAFARRLISQQSTFNNKKALDEYKKHQNLVKTRVKQTSFTPMKMPPHRLPALNIETKGYPEGHQISVNEIRSASTQMSQTKRMAFKRLGYAPLESRSVVARGHSQTNFDTQNSVDMQKEDDLVMLQKENIEKTLENAVQQSSLAKEEDEEKIMKQYLRQSADKEAVANQLKRESIAKDVSPLSQSTNKIQLFEEALDLGRDEKPAKKVEQATEKVEEPAVKTDEANGSDQGAVEKVEDK